MEVLHSQISTNKSQIRNPKTMNYSHNPRPYENFLAPSFHNNGLLQVPPPFLSHSYPPYSFHQPPLLPLPTASPRHITVISRTRSSPPANRKSNSPKKNPKKPKPLTNSPTNQAKKLEKKPSQDLRVSSTSPLGPDPTDLPKSTPKVLSLISSTGNGNVNSNGVKPLVIDQFDNKFSGSVVLSFSPPPSSLPLPTFSLRPKLSCKAEAGNIDAGATNNLRRLLRLP